MFDEATAKELHRYAVLVAGIDNIGHDFPVGEALWEAWTGTMGQDLNAARRVMAGVMLDRIYGGTMPDLDHRIDVADMYLRKAGLLEEGRAQGVGKS